MYLSNVTGWDTNRLAHGFNFYISITILSWNCRGAGNEDFRNSFTELIRVHKPDLVILIETKVSFSSTGNFFNNLGFSLLALLILWKEWGYLAALGFFFCYCE